MSQSLFALNEAASPSIFNFGSHAVRIIVRDGDPWFVAGDVASALGYRDAANAARNLKDHQRGTHNLSTPSGVQRVTIITESGLYKLVLRSRKPEAEEFSDWVTGEVLPSIRKTGSYSKVTTEETIAPLNTQAMAAPQSEPKQMRLDDAVRLDHAFHLASHAAAQVQRAVFNAVMAGEQPNALTSQWMLYFHTKSWGDKATDAYCNPLANDAICLGPDAYLANLERGDGHVLSTDQLAHMAEFATKKLASRVRQQASLAADRNQRLAKRLAA